MIEVGSQSFVLETGDAVTFPGDVPHAYANPAPSAARFSLSVFEPAVGASSPRGGITHA